MLLNHGADVNVENIEGKTPLHQAFVPGLYSEASFGIVQLLLECGADANTRDYHESPLHLASLNRHFESVRELLDHGANVNAKDSQGQTPLHQALSTGSFIEDAGFEVVQLLLERGADANTREGHEFPLHLASYNQHLGSVRVLLDHGANVNAKDSQGQTPLHQALTGSFIEDASFGVVQLLLERGADANTREGHESPLHLASYNQDLESVRALLDSGANVDAKDSQGRTPLHQALAGSFNEDADFGVVRLLVEHGASVNVQDSLGWTPLHYVFYYSNEDRNFDQEGVRTVQLLVERGANVNARNKDHATPLHLASYNQYLDSAQFLLNHGANVNAVDSLGQTSLHCLIEHNLSTFSKIGNCFSILRLLVERGADVNSTEKYHATHYTWYHSVSILNQYGCFSTTARTSMQRTPWARPHCIKRSI